MRVASTYSGWFFALLGGLLVVSSARASDESYKAGPAGDTLQLLSVTPEGPLRAGVETELTFKVDVQLASMKKGKLNIGFNSNPKQPEMMRVETKYTIFGGREVVTVKTKVKPVHYGRYGDFKVHLHISPDETEGRYTPAVSLRKKLDVLP